MAYKEVETSDETLMAAAAAGDDVAFDALVKRYETRLFSYIYRIVTNRSDAEDIFQEAFLRVYRHRHRFIPGAAFRPWLYRIATNLCRDELRRRRRRPNVPLEDCDPTGARLAPSESLAAPGPGPDGVAQADEAAGRLARALDRLTLKHRTVFLLARYEGLSYEEIGQSLDIPVGTVKSRMNKAVSVLLDELKRDRQ